MRASVAIVLVFLFASCAKKITSGTDSGRANGYSEDLSNVRPLLVVDSTLVVVDKEKVEGKGSALNKYKYEEPRSNNAEIENALLSLADYNALITEAPGFRIQVFSGNSRAEFESAKGFLLQYFPELEIYESYSQPTYRIKAGDFLKRMHAEKYYSALLERFGSSKVVMDKVDVQKSYKIK